MARELREVNGIKLLETWAENRRAILDAQKNQTAYSKTYSKNGQLNAGRPWTEADLQQLQALHAQGVSIEEICKQLQRRPRGVERQLALLERASSKNNTKRSGPRNSGMP